MKKIGSLLLAMLFSTTALASQNPISNPTSGTLPGLTMIQNYNAALDTLATNFSGGTAPSSPLTYQFWVDTSASPKSLKIYDGASWLTIGQIDTSGHAWGARGNSGQFGTVITTGAATLNSASVTNNATVGGTLGVTGSTSLTGAVGIGGASSASVGVIVQPSALTGTTQYGVNGSPVFSSSATANGLVFASNPATAAAGFTMPALTHYAVGNVSLGSGSAVTAQYGFSCSSLSGATANWCFYSSDASVPSYHSGNFLVNTTTASGKLSVASSAAGGYGISVQGANFGGSYYFQEFKLGTSSQVGSISSNGSTTSYNTTSDKRLKEDVQPLDDAGLVIDRIEPVTYRWKFLAGNPRGVGFLAQDLYKIVPEAVTQGDGNASLTPDMEGFRQWAVDYSKLMPYAVAEIKALRARVAVLESENQAMKADIAAIKSHVAMTP